MSPSKTDIRVVRTRKMIMEAFIDLSRKKEFKDITIKDITEAAMINRSTFYYHFEDIYDLLEKSLFEVLSVNLSSRPYRDSELNEEMIVNIFLAITDFQKSIHNRCYRGYEDIIARIIRDQLEVIFYRVLKNQFKNDNEQTLQTLAVMLSWGVYGASEEWRRNSEKIEPEKYIKSVIPYLASGMIRHPENDRFYR